MIIEHIFYLKISLAISINFNLTL